MQQPVLCDSPAWAEFCGYLVRLQLFRLVGGGAGGRTFLALGGGKLGGTSTGEII